MHGDLSSYMTNHPVEARTQAQQISIQVLEGLVVLHEREICHRDLKPQVKSPTPTTTHPADSYVECTDGVPFPAVGQDYRLRNRQDVDRHPAPNPLWHHILSSA